MKSPNLTSRPRRVRGKLTHDYEVDGKLYTVFDSARNALLVIELFADDSFTPEEKAALLIRMVFADESQVPDTAQGFAKVLAEIAWDAYGLDITDTHEHGTRAFDWQQDAGRIRSSLFMAYGLDWDEICDSRSYAEVCDLLAMLMESESKTPFQEAVYYRLAKPPKASSSSAEYVSEFKKRQRHFRLEGSALNAQQIAEENERQIIDALKRAAR